MPSSKLLEHRIGAHLSAKGSVLNVFLEAKDLEIKTAACFTSPKLQYGIERKIPLEIATEFQKTCDTEKYTVYSHACYLSNIANNEKEDNYQKSILSVISELSRCESAGILGTVIHPGSNPKREKGLDTIILSIEKIFDQYYPLNTLLLLESSAGQGNTLPVTINEVSYILNSLSAKARKKCKIALDTCHLHSAGYNLADPLSVVEFISLLDEKLGIENIELIHLNDSQTPCNSRKDRHGNIGTGTIALEGMATFLNHPKIKPLPKILETPVNNHLEWKKDLQAIEAMLD